MMSVRPLPRGIVVTAARAAQPVTVRPAPVAPLQTRVLFAGPPGREGRSGLDAETAMDLAGWYQLQKEL